VDSLLTRSGVPHAFVPLDDPRAEALLRDAGTTAGADDVIVAMPAVDGRVLRNPTTAEVVENWGVKTTLRDHDYDVVVVGAGPAGLAAAVYAASEGLRTLVVERESIGGQAATSTLIRNYLGFSRGVTGAELTQRGYQQAWVFGASFLMVNEVVGLHADGERWVLDVTPEGPVTARAVILAMGVAWRRLGAPGIEERTGSGVFYAATASDAHALAGLRGVVVGGGNSAAQATLHLARYAAHATLVVRGEALGAGMSQYLVDQIEATPQIEVRLASEVVGGAGEPRLRTLDLRDNRSGVVDTVVADGLFVMIGAVPRTEWLPPEVARDGHGFVLTGQALADARAPWPLSRRPELFETGAPRVFAVGDVRAASVKRVASAVGEGSVVVAQVHQCLAHPSG
jgi:thioredoxin reductase (NADPH)